MNPYLYSDSKIAQRLTAYSIAPNARDWMMHTQQPRILNIFERSYNLINERGEVASIVSPKIGNGPFNIVLKNPQYPFFNNINIGSPLIMGIDHITIGGIIIDVQEAATWLPWPDWEQFRSHREIICTRIPDLVEWIKGRTPTASLFELFDKKWWSGQRTTYSLRVESSSCLNTVSVQPSPRVLNVPILDYVHAAFIPARKLCYSVINADTKSSREAVQHLAGLGPGLTPAGDDFILGAIFAARIIHPEETAIFLTKKLAEAAAPLTTSLSAAWLRAASRGEAGARWHDFFATLPADNPLEIRNSADQLLEIGHSSGADSLAGFLGTLLFFMNQNSESCHF